MEVLVLLGFPRGCQNGFPGAPWNAHSYAGFFAAEEMANLKTNPAPYDEASKLFSLLRSDANEQYGGRDDIRIFGFDESPNEDP